MTDFNNAGTVPSQGSNNDLQQQVTDRVDSHVQPPTQPQSSIPGQPPSASPQQPNAPKPPVAPAPPTPATGDDSHPAVKVGKLMADVARTFVPTKKVVDLETGEMKTLKPQVSRADIGMAIAMSAVSGALAGLQAKGPNHLGQAAALGFQQTASAREKLEDDQMKKANDDYARNASIAQTNMKMEQMARFLADSDYQTHERNVQGYASTAEEASSLPDAVMKADIGEDEAQQMVKDSTLHVTKDMLIPIRTVEKLDANGKAMKGPHGAPVWEERYMVVKPTAELTMPKDVLELLQQHHVQGYVDRDNKPIPLSSDLKLRLHMIVHGIEEANKIRFTDQALRGFANGQLHHLHQDTKMPSKDSGTSGPSTTLSQLFTDDKGSVDFGKLADAFIKHESPKASNVGNRNNNPGNIGDAAWTKTQPGYAGAGEGGFAKFDTAEHGRQALVAMLKRDMPKYGDQPVENYINDVYSPDSAKGNGPGQAAAYAGHLMQIAGKPPQAQTQTAGVPSDHVTQMLDSLTPQDRQTLLQAGGLDAFTQGKPGEEAPIDKLVQQGKFSSQSVGRLKAVLNQIYPSPDGVSGIEQYRQDRLDTLEKNKVKSKADAEKDLMNENQKYLHSGPEGFRVDPEARNLNVAQLAAHLKSSGVAELPEIFDTLYLAGHYGMTPNDFAQRVWAKGSPGEMDRQSAINYILKYINPYFNEMHYQDLWGMRKSASNPDSGFSKQITSFQQLLAHIGEAIDSNDEYRRLTGGKKLNEPVSWWKDKMSGDPNFRDYLAAVEPAAKEYETFLLGNHALQKEDRAEIDKIIGGSLDRANAEIVLKRWAKTAAIRAKDTDDKWHRVSGTHYPDFINNLALHGVSKLTDENGKNEVMNILGDLDTGGNLEDSPTGWGNPGQKVRMALGHYQAGDVVSVKGQMIKITSVTPDGKFQGVPAEGN